MRLLFAAFLIMALASFVGAEERGKPSAMHPRMREAKVFAQAGAYEKARELYGFLLEQHRKSWKKEVLLYDIATTYLQEELWEEAIRRYESISLGNKSFPLLIRSVKTNLAIARWRLAKEYFRKIQDEPVYYQENYLKALFLLKATVKDIDEAEKTHCQVLKLEGDDHCEPAYDLARLRTAAEQEYAALVVDYMEKRTQQISLREGIPLLMSGINSIVLALEELSPIKMSNTIKDQQMSRISRQAASWSPLFFSLQEKVSLLNNPEKNRSFHQSEEAFFEALKQLKKRSLNRSIGSLKMAEKALSELIFLILEEDPIQETIQKVQASYERALASVPLQARALQGIDDEQETVAELFQRKDLSQDVLKKAREALARSIDYAQKGKETLARIFLYHSSQMMQRLSWDLDKKGLTPQKILERALSEQLYSFIINQHLNETTKPHEEEIIQMGVRGQEGVLAFALPFWEEVIKAQWDVYHGEDSEEGEKETLRCQYFPWSEVVPLFDKGFDEASYALDILQGEGTGVNVFFHQQNAMRYWKEALEKLKEPPKQDSCSKPPKQEQQPQEPKKEEKQQARQPEKPSIEEVLRLLQQMEHDDRQEKRQGMRSGTGEKQW